MSNFVATKATMDITEILYHRLLEPSGILVRDIARLEGDIIILGAGGKMGPALAKLARQAIDRKAVVASEPARSFTP